MTFSHLAVQIAALLREILCRLAIAVAIGLCGLTVG